MESKKEEMTTLPSSHLQFGDFPEDIQVNVISFLTPAEISALACTSRRFASLCSPIRPCPSVWLPVLSRRWGAHTTLPSWALPPSPALYRLLHLWDPLIGFWRRIGNSSHSGSTPPLLLFEWGPSFITASTISPSSDPSSYKVLKTPFLWMGVSTSGEPVSYRISESGDPIAVNFSFLGNRHFVVEETFGYEGESSREVDPEGKSLPSPPPPPPDAMMFEIYEYLANRTSPGGGQRRRKGRDRFGKRRWEAEHFVRITDAGPTPSMPLQGLWKGICEGLSLDFFLVTYDDVGGVTCRRVGDSSELFSGYSPVFWTSHTTFLESPFSIEEQGLYGSREHVTSGGQADIEWGAVSRILSINSSYELVLPGLAGTGDPRNVEGRIWEYDNGTFGFGFLRDNFIIDLKHIALDGRLLDTVE